MGRRSRQSFIKRAKEKKRQEKAALKRERRLARRRGEAADHVPTEEGTDGNLGTDATTHPGAIVQALVLVGLQNDFFPGGALGVPGGDEVLPVANRLIDEFSRVALPIVATRDWHPPAHRSFTDHGGPWPPHCVADTPGACFHSELQLPSDATIITMNAEREGDVFSGFHETDLARKLRALDVTKVVICGLATDYFVKATALDGRSEGFDVTVVQEGIRGFDEHPGDSVAALREMERAGVGIATVGTLIASSTT